MTPPPLAPRATLGGVIAVWVCAVLIGVAIGLFVPVGERALWLGIGLGGCLILAFAVQLGYGTPHRFVDRIAMSMLGALVILALIAAGFGLAALAAM